MRVASGKFGGRKLADNPYSHIRPTADIVKQSIFNKLAQEVKDSRVLDVFCGTGALGIEALSRGAREVVFIDSNIKSINLTKENLQKLGIEARTICADYVSALNRLRGENFDIIIMDPPYKSGVYEKALEEIKKNQLLSENGIVVCEHEKDIEIDAKDFQVLDEKQYGIKSVLYLIK